MLASIFFVSPVGRALSRAVALFCLCHAAYAADKPVMIWLVVDGPPASRPVDGRLTDGFFDVAIQLVEQEWPEVEHKVVVTNAGRAVASLAEGAQACFSGAVRTPERERMAFFTPTHLSPALRLIAKPATLAKLRKNARGEVLPANLFDREELRGIIIAHRSYSPVIDALLSLRPAKSGVKTVVTTDGGANILQMLALDRADYTLTYEHSLTYLMNRSPKAFQQAALTSAPLAGTEPVVSGIYCPHTEWGRDAITRIDAILARVSQTPQYQAALNRWLSPATLRQNKAALAGFYQQRAKPTDPARFQLVEAAR